MKSNNSQIPLSQNTRIAIIGAGPTGLGAAHRLAQLGLGDVTVYDRNAYAGGLAASFVDDAGFTWDVGGHVQFSHYSYFDCLMDDLLGLDWLNHERESWIWLLDRFVPYPFQKNIQCLPPAEMKECLLGLIRARCNGSKPVRTLEDWIQGSFGEGIARLFMRPYNYKVWAYPTSRLSNGWLGERVATVNLEEIIDGILENRPNVSWGPNRTFRFPLRGGTGAIWAALAARLPQDRLCFGREVAHVDTARKTLTFTNGEREEYDVLISTMPVDALIERSDLDSLRPAAARLLHSTVHVVGVGLKGAPLPHLARKCWMYFPEDNTPFYRATVFSNYSPHNVPDAAKYWSLMMEVSESPEKPVDRAALIDSVIAGLCNTRLIEGPSQIASVWRHTAGHGYPTPALGRDEALAAIQPELERRGIYSRGRFGGWKYEVSNQDHSLMQGVELVNRLAFGVTELTYLYPDVANRIA